MNPMFAAAVGSVIRWGLAFVAGYLVQRGIWSDSEAGVYVGAAAIGISGLLWSVYQKYASRSKLMVALATPRVISEAEAETIVKVQDQRPPVTMDKDRVPYIVGTTQRQDTVKPVAPLPQPPPQPDPTTLGLPAFPLRPNTLRPPPPSLPPPPDVED